MYEEAIAWTKACIGPLAMADMVGRALVGYEAQKAGGSLGAVERSTNRTRYTISAPDPGNAREIATHLKEGIQAFTPFQEVYIDWIASMPESGTQEGYPFRIDRECSSFIRHKMNLLFATCGQADALIAKGYKSEARRLLFEAAMLEPNADFIQERIEAIPDK